MNCRVDDRKVLSGNCACGRVQLPISAYAKQNSIQPHGNLPTKIPPSIELNTLDYQRGLYSKVPKSCKLLLRTRFW